MNWNDRLTHIVANNDLYSEAELQEMREVLNKEGLQLTEALEGELKGRAKVKYLPE